MSYHGHRPSGSTAQNAKAHLTQSYNELGKELASTKLRVVGNYTLGKVIGEGAFGKVRMGTHRMTGTKVAVKQIPKAMSASLTREIHFHRSLHHPHIVQLYEIIASESTVWLATELCSGGELFDYLLEKGRLGEDETRIIYGQLCLAVAYLHAKNIVHRDLKLENVLLDEKCRVKLSDFGFIREYEKNILMETFCGTTGYAAPEVLSQQKYLGPEVDIWSLGVILYTLLTGTLPFDDEDEQVMKAKVIQGEFEDPEWLSDESRDLLQSLLQQDPTKRPTIQEMLSHRWFTSPSRSSLEERLTSLSSTSLASPIDIPSAISQLPSSPVAFTGPFDQSQEIPSAPSSVTSDASATSFVSASSEPLPMTPTETEGLNLELASLQRNASQKTLTKPDARASTLEVLTNRPLPLGTSTPPRSPRSRSTLPPPLPSRTPARTKRRSVSSALSDTPGPQPPARTPQDYAALLAAPAPLLFSTPLERGVLTNLSGLGFDTAQIVHSVLSDACDATGALWWMLRRKAELRALENGVDPATLMLPSDSLDSTMPELEQVGLEKERKKSTRSSRRRDEDGMPTSQSAPAFAIVPATPTVSTHMQNLDKASPPRALSPLLSPVPSSSALTLSAPSTPGNSTKDKDARDTGSKSKRDSKHRNRSGSVSIMQRATTALEAAGIVRKKSSEVIKDHAVDDKDAAQLKGDSTRSSHGSGSNKLTKSPPLKAIKDALMGSTTSLEIETPHPHPRIATGLAVPAEVGSPWVLTKRSNTSPPTTSSQLSQLSNDDTLTSLPGVEEPKTKNRASLLGAFRMWFDQDRKSKRKGLAGNGSPGGSPSNPPYNRSISSPGPGSGSRKSTMKRRATSNLQGMGLPVGSRPVGRPRMSMSSRRSSSVNSRRSSITSIQVLLDSPSQYDHMPSITRQRSDASRRSHGRGSDTPTSERDGSSRPSSVHSYYRQHRKSPSDASGQSRRHRDRDMSPLPSKHHRRGNSGSSNRVMRTLTSPAKNKPLPSRPLHTRSSSAASIQSLSSSRPPSLYDLSESENGGPSRRHRRSFDDTPRRGYKKHGAVIHGRSSWKKSWGTEPPGWGSRASHLPIEVLAISPLQPDTAGGPVSVRDVFSGRQSMNLGGGDESDWVDEDDDIAFAGGLGQFSGAASGASVTAGTSTSGSAPAIASKPEAYVLSAPPKAKGTARPTPGGGMGKRGGGGAHAHTQGGGRVSPVQEAAHEQVVEMRTSLTTRRAPVGRVTSSYRAPAIQEEDEEEEEE